MSEEQRGANGPTLLFNEYRSSQVKQNGSSGASQQTTRQNQQSTSMQQENFQQVQQPIPRGDEQWINEEQRPEVQISKPNVVQQFAHKQIQRASKAAVKEGKESVNIIYSSLLDLYNVFMDSRSLVSKPIIVCFAIIGITVIVWNLVFDYFTFIEPLQILATLIIYLILVAIVKALEVRAFTRLKDYVRKEVRKNERSRRKK